MHKGPSCPFLSGKTQNTEIYPNTLLHHCSSFPRYTPPCFTPFFFPPYTTEPPPETKCYGFPNRTESAISVLFCLAACNCHSKTGRFCVKAPVGKRALKGTGSTKTAKADAVSKGPAQLNNKHRHKERKKQHTVNNPVLLSASFPSASGATNCHCRFLPSIRPFF